MNWNSFFIKDLNEFGEFKKILDVVFCTDEDLPNKVFQAEYKTSLFIDFDFMMSDKTWDFLKELALTSKDDYVVMAVLDPDPKDYYYKEFGYFNWVRLPINISSNEYGSILDEGPPDSIADAIITNSFKIVWFSPSKKWGIWADRNCEISVISFKNNDKNYASILKSWYPVQKRNSLKLDGLYFYIRKGSKHIL